MKTGGNKLGGKRHHKPAIAAVALGAFMSVQAGAARADDTAAEIRFLKARLKQLEEKVARQDKQIRGVAKLPAMPPETPIVCKDQPCPPPLPAPPPIFVSFANGLKVESFDHDFSFKIGGRIFVDGGVNSHPVEAFAGFPVGSPLRPLFPSHSASGFSNQVGFRQARLEVEGKAWRDWYYKFQYDFTGAPNDLIAGGFRDVWLAWQPQWGVPSDIVCKDQPCPPSFIKPIAFQVGSQFEASSMERMASSKYRDFIERALPSDLLAGNRHVGFAAVTGGDAPGIWGKPNWSLKAGIYSTSFEDGNPFNGAVTTNAAGAVTAVNFGLPAGNSNLLNPVPGGHQYWDAAVRLTYAPIRDEEHLLHLGGWVRYQKPNDATAANDDRVLQPGSTLKSEANIVGDTLLGTQPLTCFAIPTAQLVGSNCVKNVLNYGAELVASWGPFSIQGEYIGIHYDRNPAIIVFQGAPGAASVNFDGFYAYATWYLTGESRAEAYRSYPEEFNQPANDNVAQIKILHPWSAGGWGAWELAARVSEINLNSGGFINATLAPAFTSSPVSSASNILNIQGGRQSDFTLGLNWYPDKGIRFMANWVNVFQYSAPFNRPDLKGIHPNMFVFRAQVDW
jgi:phosphate-selective porin OprO and OprP